MRVCIAQMVPPRQVAGKTTPIISILLRSVADRLDFKRQYTARQLVDHDERPSELRRWMQRGPRCASPARQQNCTVVPAYERVEENTKTNVGKEKTKDVGIG